MLMRLVLLVIQLVVAFFGVLFAAPYMVDYTGDLGQWSIFVYAVLFALIMFIVGFLLSAMVRNIRSPTSGTLTFSVLLALLGAGATLVPAIMGPLSQASLYEVNPWLLPLAGAAIGYLIKR